MKSKKPTMKSKELIRIWIKKELHRMLYSKDFDTVETLQKGVERLNFNILLNHPDTDPEMEIETKISMKDGIFLARTDLENLSELKEIVSKLKNVSETMEIVHKQISYMVLDTELELFEIKNKKGE